MKNRIVFFISLILSVSAAYSQAGQLTIEGSPGKFYLSHTVIAKENWYSIGRLFNCPPHDIASFNDLNFDKPLEVATVIRIPLNASNFDQKDVKSAGESLIPIYHVVEDKEWMFKVSSIYNDVPVTSLEKWNKIKRDDVKKGTSLIVGFLKVKTDLSPLAMGVSSNPAGAISAAPIKSADPVSNQTTSVQTPAKPAIATATNMTANSVIPASNPPERVNNYALTHSNGGFFSIDYTGMGKSASGTAGTFKSTSGWTDGKYYALMNGVAVGTIVRITAANAKTVYAKVLGQLPDMKESAGLLIRISNAASAELGLGDGKFQVDIKY